MGTGKSGVEMLYYQKNVMRPVEMLHWAHFNLKIDSHFSNDFFKISFFQDSSNHIF